MDPTSTSARLTLRAFFSSLDFADFLVLTGWFFLAVAGWFLHSGLGIGIIGAGLMLVGVRSGRAA